MPYNYDETIEDVIIRLHTTRENVFFYEGMPLEVHYDNIFQFCQENLETMNAKYGIQPAKMFFNGGRVIGARAQKNNNSYSVSLNFATIILFHEFIREHFYIDDQVPEGTMLNIDDHPLQYIMFQTVVLFVYYHELAHLIQMSDSEQYQIGEDYPFNEEGQVYSREQHLREMDADLFAANYICDHIMVMWREHPNPTSVELQSSVAAAITSLYALFLKSQGGHRDLYFEEHIHPHPMIRITYIQDYILRRIQDIKPPEIAFNSTEVLRAFMVTFQPRVQEALPGHNFIDYAQTIVEHQQPITDFVLRLMHERENMPELVINRQRRNRVTD